MSNRSVELVNPIVLFGREINSFSAEAHALEVLGNPNIKLLRDKFLKKLNEEGLGKPLDKRGGEIEEPYFKHKKDFYHRFNVTFEGDEFDILATVALEPIKEKSREYPSGVFHVLDVQITLKAV